MFSVNVEVIAKEYIRLNDFVGLRLKIDAGSYTSDRFTDFQIRSNL